MRAAGVSEEIAALRDFFEKSAVSWKFNYGGLRSSAVYNRKNYFMQLTEHRGENRTEGFEQEFRSFARIMEEERSITEYCASRLSEISHVRLIGQGPHRHGPVVSFVSDLLDPGDLAYVLQSSFGIVTRAGLHCAPLIHDHIGSAPKGTLRVSFSFCTVKDDIDRLADALKELS